MLGGRRGGSAFCDRPPLSLPSGGWPGVPVEGAAASDRDPAPALARHDLPL